MKKLIILVSILVLIASGMAFGQLTYQGKVYYGALTNFEDAPGMGWDIRNIFTAKIDDFNTAQMRIRMRNFADTSVWNTKYPSWTTAYLLSSDAPFIDRAWLSTDITGALGMKDGAFSAQLYSGFWWDYTDDLSDGVSPFEVADLTQMDLGTGGKQGVFNLNTNIAKMLDVRASVAPNDGNQNAGGWKVVAGANIPAGPGKLYPQFTFGAPSGRKSGEGTIIMAAKYTQAMGDIGLTLLPQFRYNLDADANGGNLAFNKTVNVDGDLIQYYVALAGVIQYQKLATIKFGYLGYDGSMANRFEANVLLTPAPQFGVEVGTIVNLDQDEYEVAEGKSALQVIDLGAFIMAGKTRIKFGYIALGKEGMADPLNQDLSEVGRNGSACKQGGMYFETLVSF